ncbi:hypothetical protein O3G_MSEX000992 [Manduca sexta]|nr:hypothetical protein O3G_MSEX000992 [Manduca sexta]
MIQDLMKKMRMAKDLVVWMMILYQKDTLVEVYFQKRTQKMVLNLIKTSLSS